MSRKTLLTEAEVRQFLKLANIGPVGDAKVQEMYSAPGKDDDLDEKQRKGTKPPGQRDEEQMEEGEELDEMYPAARDDEDAMADMGDAADDMGDAADDMDDAAMDMGDAPGAGKMVAIEDFMGALERALEDVLGDEVDVDMDDEDADDDMGAAMDMGDDDDDPMMEADDELDEGDDHDDERMEEEAIVNEVARRVAARLQQKNQKENMVEELAEKILNRITSK